MSVCNYLYVHGGRFGSGECVVEVLIDGQVKKLALVRDGKGRSRTDRWGSRPRSDGAVGEISIRDLASIKAESGETSVDLWVNGVYMRSLLGRDISMGREGRTSVADLEYTMRSLDDEGRRKIAISQVRNASYGSGSADDTRERVLLALSHLTPDEVRELRDGATAAVASLTQIDLLRILVYKCGAVGVRYSGEIEFDPVRSGSVRDTDLARVSESIDKASGVVAGVISLRPDMLEAIVEMYLSGEVDVSRCPDIEAALIALRLLESALADEVPPWEEFAGLDDTTLKALIFLHPGLRHAVRSLSDDELLAHLSNNTTSEAVLESWREVERRELRERLSYAEMLAAHSKVRFTGSDRGLVGMESAIKYREATMISLGGQSEVLLRTPFKDSAEGILEKMEDRDIVDMMSSAAKRLAVLSGASSEAAVGVLDNRGSAHIMYGILETTVRERDLFLGSLVMGKLPSATVAEVASDPTVVESTGRDSWCSRGVGVLSRRLRLGEIGAAEYENLVTTAISAAVIKGVKETAMALAIPYSSESDDTKRIMSQAWGAVASAVSGLDSAVETIRAIDAVAYPAADAMPELKPLMARWGHEIAKERIISFVGAVEESSRLQAEKENDPGSYVYVPNAAYSNESGDLVMLVKMSAAAGVDMGHLHREITSLDHTALEMIHRPRMEIAYGIRGRLQARYRSCATPGAEAVRQSLEFLDRESTCTVALEAAVTTVIQALNQESRITKGTDRGAEMFGSHRDGIAEMRSKIESADHFTGLEDTARKDLAALMREIEEEYPTEAPVEDIRKQKRRLISRKKI